MYSSSDLFCAKANRDSSHCCPALDISGATTQDEVCSASLWTVRGSMESDASGVSGEGERDAGAVAEEEEEDMSGRAQGGEYNWLVLITVNMRENLTPRHQKRLTPTRIERMTLWIHLKLESHALPLS